MFTKDVTFEFADQLFQFIQQPNTSHLVQVVFVVGLLVLFVVLDGISDTHVLFIHCSEELQVFHPQGQNAHEKLLPKNITTKSMLIIFLIGFCIQNKSFRLYIFSLILQTKILTLWV